MAYFVSKLLRQDLFEEFCDEFTREMNRLRMEHRASLSAAEREIDRIEARRKKLIEMVMEGVPPSEVKDELTANAARREDLKAKLVSADEYFGNRGRTDHHACGRHGGSGNRRATGANNRFSSAEPIAKRREGLARGGMGHDARAGHSGT
jgi:hypothetical protein